MRQSLGFALRPKPTRKPGRLICGVQNAGHAGNLLGGMSHMVKSHSRRNLFRRLREMVISFSTLSVAIPVTAVVVELPAAEAQAKKKKKSRKTAKTQAKAPEAKQEPTQPELRTTGPASLKIPMSEKNFDNSAKADVRRDAAIEEIRNLLPKVKGGQKGELVFRLAELYWEKSRYIYAKEFKGFDENYQKWVDEGRQGKEPKLANYIEKSEAYKKQALTNYSYVLENHPEYPRLDEVLYIMAYNQYDAGNKKKALKNYSKLIKQYPNSEYVSDSYLALGEHYFTANNLTKATKAYRKAYKIGVKSKKPGTYLYAQYKLAWCDYNAQDFEGALKRFKDVIETSDREKAGEGVRLKRESINDMVLTYSQLEAVDEAFEFLKSKAGGQEAYRLMTKLAKIYKGQGKHRKEIDTYRFVLALNPDDVNAPDYQSSIVAAYSTLSDRDAVRKEVRRMVELYRPGSPWWRKNEGDAMAVDRARTLAESRMRELVTEYHRFAQKFKKAEDYFLARDIYKEYLEAFPDSDEAYRLNFYYAEILWDLDQWEDAAVQYDNVVKRNQEGEYTRNSAWNAILAWEKIVKGEKARSFKEGQRIDESDRTRRKTGQVKKTDIRSLEKIQKGKTYEAKDIPAVEVKLAAACDRYVEVVPEKEWRKSKELTNELIVVKFKAAYTYQNYYHFDEAATRFGELIDRWPDNEYARRGAELILDSYDARAEWNNLEHWARVFVKNSSLMQDKKFASQARKFMEGASFKSIAQVNEKAGTLDKAGDKGEATKLYAEVAQRFEGFVDEFPQSAFAPIALYNSTVIYDRAKQLDLAIRAANKLLKNYDKELKAGDNLENRIEEYTILNLARFNEMVANYQVAADTYRQFADQYKDNEKSPDAIYNAAVFYLGLGDTKTAVQTFERYLKDYPKQKDVADVYLQMASAYEDSEDWQAAATTYGAFEAKFRKQAKPEQVLSSLYKTAFALQQQDKMRDSLRICTRILADLKNADAALKNNEAAQLAGGYCAFQSLEAEWRAYTDIKIVARKGGNAKAQMKQIRDALDLKAKTMREVAKKYVEVLNYGNGEWGVAGLYRAAEAYLDYVKTLRDAPDPPPLVNNYDALDLFRSELENIVFPVEDEAIRALEAALAKAFELGIYSEYTLAIQERLKTFQPGAYGLIRELEFYPSTGTEQTNITASR